MGDVAAHRPGVRLDADRVEAHPREGPLVRTVFGGIALLEPGLVGVEAVRVLHHELARAEEPGARARLVAAFRLEVIDDLRQLPVALELLLRVQVHELLVRVAHHELAPVVVGGAEGDRLERIPTAGLLPRLGGRQDGHLHLLCADAVLLLANDLLDLLRDAEPERQPRVEACRERARDRGAEHQAMAGSLRFRRRFPKGAAKERRLSHQ